jgi:branched-chain amino acid transport system ATP-binding protein
MAEEDLSNDSALLRCSGITKSFGGVQALKEVSFAVPKLSVIGLIGPNGAGKTTVFNCLTGFIQPDKGELWFKGRRVDGQSPNSIARMGLIRTFQSIRMFARLTVFESLLVAQFAAGRRTSERPRLRLREALFGDERMQQVSEILDLLGLSSDRNRLCTELPLLSQRKVEVARALACQPTMLLLDEPSAGATLAESKELMAVIDVVHKKGITVLVIEHNVPFIMGTVDSVIVINFGETIAQGTPAEITDNEIVQEIYLGASENAQFAHF